MKKPGRIERRFIVTVGLVILFMLAVLASLTWFVVRNYSEVNVYDLAQLASSETDNRLTSTFNEIEMLARSLSRFDAVKNLDREVLLKLLYDTVIERNNYIRSIYIGTADGEMLQRGYGAAFTNGITILPEGYDPRKRPWFQLAKTEGTYVITELYVYASIKALGITVAIPLRNSDQEFTGVLGIDITLDRLQNIVRDLKVPRQGKGLLVNSKGEVIASQFDLRTAELATELKKSDIEEIDEILKMQSGARIIHRAGKEYFAGFQRNKLTGWITIVVLPYDVIMQNVNEMLFLLIASFVGLIVIVITVIIMQIRHTLNPIRSLMQAIGEMTAGNFSARSTVHSNDEIGILSDSFNKMSETIEERNRLITAQNEELESKVEARTQELQEKNLQMTKDLKMAQRIQLSIIPDDKTFPKRPEVSFSAKYQAMENLGGDIYDIIRMGKNSIGFMMADVSGHGVPAALITTMVKVAFQSHAHFGAKPGDILTDINTEMFKFIGDLEYYLSAYFCILNLETGELQYTNAGHHPAILQRGRDGALSRLDTKGYFIGSFQDGSYETSSITLEPGDRVLLFTDGITEAKNMEGEFYDYDRLMDYIRANPNLPPRLFVDGLARDVETFCGESPQNDDRALLFIEFTSKVGSDQAMEGAFSAEGRELGSRKGDFKSRYMEAVRAIKNGNYAFAQTTLLDLIKIHPDDTRVANNLGVAYFRMGEAARAIATLEDALKLNPDNESLIKNLNFIMKELENGA